MRPLEDELRWRIRDRGPLTFAEFMDLALYWPSGGYYASRPSPIGPLGDFYTSPVAHPAFAACISLQLEQMWAALGRPSQFYVVEPGAGDGLLCHDILTYLENRHAALLSSLQYVLLDRSGTPGLEQELPSHLRTRIQRLHTSTIPLQNITGCLLANELLDAFSVHRVMTHHGRLQEMYVDLDGSNNFVEIARNPSTSELETRLKKLDIRLAEGHRTEINLDLGSWIRTVTNTLNRGFVLIVDYGQAERKLHPQSHQGGSLRCYYKHTLNADPYTRVGRQDISVHVDFTTLERAAVCAGLNSLGHGTQREFLLNLGLGFLMGALNKASISQEVRQYNLAGMINLIAQDGLGAFRVLALGKGVDKPRLNGFYPGNSSLLRLSEDLTHLPIPLASSHHMPFSYRPCDASLPSLEELMS